MPQAMANERKKRYQQAGKGEWSSHSLLRTCGRKLFWNFTSVFNFNSKLAVGLVGSRMLGASYNACVFALPVFPARALDDGEGIYVSVASLLMAW